MKHGVFISGVFFATISVSAFAQTQTGYVRTVGRPDNKAGERLPGVEIRVNGLHGAVVSEEDGVFDFDLQGGKDSYQLSSVFFDNYELNEKEVIGRTFGVTKIPQEIVMVSLAEKNKIRRKVEEQVEARYKARLDELQRKYNAKEIEADDYHRQYQELESVYDKREQLVSDMAERYSHTDYAVLKPIEAEINAFIEQGELEKADSVINTLNIAKLEADRKILIEDIDKKESQLLLEKASKASIDSTLLIAYRGKVDILRAEFENDSTAGYYEKMIAIDSTDVSLLLEYGNFLMDYMADYVKSIIQFQSALRQSLAMKSSHNVAMSYNCIGDACECQGNYSEALENYQVALDVWMELYGSDNRYIALLYNNLGLVYKDLGDYAQSLEFYQKALDIWLQLYGERHPDVAMSYNNIGMVYLTLDNYTRMLEYCQKALDIFLHVYGNSHPSVATLYNNIGSAYSDKGEYSKALDYFQNALDVQLKILGDCHPSVATSYNNIGGVYYKLGEYSKALELYQKDFDILLRIHGESHPDIATSYNNIGAIYDGQGEYSKALDCYHKSLDIRLQIYGDIHSSVATSYSNLGVVYYHKRDYSKAQEFYQKSLDIRLQIFGDSHPDVAMSYNNLGFIYSSQGNEAKALEFYQKALDIKLEVYGEFHPSVAISYSNLGTVYYNLRDYDRALEFYQKSLDIKVKVYGKNHPSVAPIYRNIGNCYLSLQNYEEAILYLDNCIKSYEMGYDENISFLTSLRMTLYSILVEHYPENVQEYLRDKLYIMTLEDGLPASQRGYSGVINVLEYGGWNVESNEDLLKYSKALKGKEKNLVFMQDGKIYREIFEDSIGGQFGLKQVTIEEKQSVINQYREWKQQNADK